MKKIFLLSQEVNDGYDTFDSAIVCAEGAEQARLIHPYTQERYKNWNGRVDGSGAWCTAKDVTVREIGIANDDVEVGVLLGSFNAG